MKDPEPPASFPSPAPPPSEGVPLPANVPLATPPVDQAPLPAGGNPTEPPLGSTTTDATATPAAALNSSASIEPPLLASPPPLAPLVPRVLTMAKTADAPRVGKGLAIALIVVGLVQLLLAIEVNRTATANSHSVDYRLGFIIGGVVTSTLIFPGIIMALFAIGRSFRQRRSQTIILLVVWSFLTLSNLGSLSRSRASHLRQRDLDSAITPLKNQPDTTEPFDPTTGFNFHFEDSKSTTGNLRRMSAPPAVRPPLRASQPSNEVTAALAAKFDFSAGSDERLIKSITSTQEVRYHAIVAGYIAACAEHPDEVRIALERIKFIAHFADAEDNEIPGVEDDYADATRYLNDRFPDASETILFALERTQADEFETKARPYVGAVAKWPPTDAARYWLLRAQHADRRGHAATVRDAAEKAFRLHATPEAALLLAQTLHTLNRDAEAIHVLAQPGFAGAQPWLRKRRMDLWFDLKQNNAALAEYNALQKASPALVRNFPTAANLARAGNVTAGRAIVEELTHTGATTDWQMRHRFEFELEFGTKAQAVAAYRALREQGLHNDPFLRDRFSLWVRHPTAGLAWSDLGGLIILMLIVVVVAIASALVLLPVHYWSLHRQRLAYVTSWALSPWGLGTVWLLLSVTGMVLFFALWWLAPEALHPHSRYDFADTEVEIPLLRVMTCLWTGLTLVALFLIVRGRSWRLFGGGAWGWLKAISLGVAFGFGSCVVGVLYARLIPGVKTPLGDITPAQLAVMKSLYSGVGPLGVLGVIALFVPVWEETLLRGIFLGAFAKHIPWMAANALQALLFAALHDDLKLIPFLFAFAYAAGELVRRSESLLAAMAMHVTNNTLFCLALLFVNTRTHFLG